VIAIAYAYRQRFHDVPQQMRLISGLMSNPEPLLDNEDAVQVVAHMMDTLTVVREAVDSARAQGVFNEGGAHERALILWAALRGVAETKKLDREEFGMFQEARLFELTLKALLCGWGGRPENIERIHTLVHRHLEMGT
jgi:hypothetical protein